MILVQVFAIKVLPWFVRLYVKIIRIIPVKVDNHGLTKQ